MAVLVGLTALLLGVFGGFFAVIAAIGAARLRQGTGLLACWELTPAEWEAFRSLDGREAAVQRDFTRAFVPPSAAGELVEVRFGKHDVLIDGFHLVLRPNGMPSLQQVSWLKPEDAPECLEFILAMSRGRHGGGLAWITLRVPVPMAARAEGVRVFHHFRDGSPSERVSVVLRRPGLTAAWGAGFCLAGLGIAGTGAFSGNPGGGIGHALIVAGLSLAALAWLVTLILLGAAGLRALTKQD